MPANQSTPKREERLVYVGSPFIPNPQPPELKQPGEGPFHHPSPPAQPAAVVRVPHREQWHNVTNSQTLPDRLRVITTVA
jgi:hypothetical protein